MASPGFTATYRFDHTGRGYKVEMETQSGEQSGIVAVTVRLSAPGGAKAIREVLRDVDDNGVFDAAESMAASLSNIFD